jgi:hypothetical protein
VDINQKVIRFNRRPPAVLTCAGLVAGVFGAGALLEPVNHDVSTPEAVILWILGLPLSIFALVALVIAFGVGLAGNALKFTDTAIIADYPGHVGITAPWRELTAARFLNQGPKGTFVKRQGTTRLQVLVPNPEFPGKHPDMAPLHRQQTEKGTWFEFPVDLTVRTARRVTEQLRERHPELLADGKAGPG